MIRVQDLSFTYPRGGFRLTLDRLHVEQGEKLYITGPSGSGKTTLIRLITGILKPDTGTIRVGDLEIHGGKDRVIRDFRLRRVGFIFQDFQLLEYLTVEQNVLLPFFLSRRLCLDGEVRERLARFLERTGLEGKERAFPEALSHGEKQRVAVVRALITLPGLVMGDEPTANLDRDNARSIMDLILSLVEEHRATFLLVSHDPSLRENFHRRLTLGSGGPAGGAPG